PRPASFLSPPPVLHIYVPHTPPVPAEAAPCGPASRWAAMAASPSAHRPPAPCSRELPPSGALAAAPLPHSLLHSRPSPQPCSTPPAASPPPYPPAPAPPPRAPPGVRLSAPLSPPTQSGTPGSSPDYH